MEMVAMVPTWFRLGGHLGSIASLYFSGMSSVCLLSFLLSSRKKGKERSKGGARHARTPARGFLGGLGGQSGVPARNCSGSDGTEVATKSELTFWPDRKCLIFAERRWNWLFGLAFVQWFRGF